jgi:hypothetical protein
LAIGVVIVWIVLIVFVVVIAVMVMVVVIVTVSLCHGHIMSCQSLLSVMFLNPIKPTIIK